MQCLRPATPGFVVTLIATILLAVVTFSAPYNKSVFFLKASITEGGFNGSVVFGTLGYCLELTNGTTCSKPSVGYELDINSLVGNKLPVEIPQVVVKWITYMLVLHIVALIAAAITAGFGLLAHIREMSMTCCSSCFSGFAAIITLIAFIIDLVLFFVAKARINAIGSAQIGSAIWLTLAAWILLFFSGCFYTLGKCCISKRPRENLAKKDPNDDERGLMNDTYDAERRRMNAITAEQERKKNQQKAERGLPPFDEPLIEDIQPPLSGYVPLPPGRRAVNQPPNTYPPQPPPPRQGSSYSGIHNYGPPNQDPYYNSQPDTGDLYAPRHYDSPSVQPRILDQGPYFANSHSLNADVDPYSFSQTPRYAPAVDPQGPYYSDSHPDSLLQPPRRTSRRTPMPVAPDIPPTPPVHGGNIPTDNYELPGYSEENISGNWGKG